VISFIKKIFFFLLYCLWTHCSTKCELLLLMLMLVHCKIYARTTLEYSQWKKNVRMSFILLLHGIHNWSWCIPTLPNLSQVGNLACIANQLTNKHFGGVGLLQIVFLIEKFGCLSFFEQGKMKYINTRKVFSLTQSVPEKNTKV